MPATSRSSTCNKADARARLRAAKAYLEIAALVLDEQQGDEFLNVSAGLAVLAGIAASDSICCARLARRHRGQDHRGAASLLEQAAPDGKALAALLLRLLDIKDEAHYGVIIVAPRKARDAVRWAARLIERAGEEIER